MGKKQKKITSLKVEFRLSLIFVLDTECDSIRFSVVFKN